MLRVRDGAEGEGSSTGETQSRESDHHDNPSTRSHIGNVCGRKRALAGSTPERLLPFPEKTIAPMKLASEW